MTEEINSEYGQEKKTKKNRKLLIISTIIIVFFAAVAVGVFFVYKIFFTQTGKIIRLIPDDVKVYLEVNLVKFASEEFMDISEIILDSLSELEDIDDDFKEEILDEFEDEFDLDFEDDIQSWIGQYIGFAVLDYDFDEYYFEITDIESLLVIESRDKDEAQAFVEKLVEYWEDELDADVDSDTYEGAEIFSMDNGYDTNAITVYRSFVIFSQDEDIIEDAIDQYGKDNLGDLPEYKRVVQELPNNRFLTAYVDLGDLMEVYTSIFTGLYGESVDFEELAQVTVLAAGYSISASEDGLIIDSVSYLDDEDIPEYYEDYYSKSDNGLRLPDLITEDTILFYTFQNLSETYAALMDSSGSISEDYLEALELLSEESIIDFEDLMEALDGEIAISIFESDEGILETLVGLPFGFEVIAETTDVEVIEDMIQDYIDSIEDDEELDYYGIEYDIDDVSFDDYEVTELLISMDFLGGYATYYGTGEDLGFISSSLDALEDGFDDKNLSSSDVYIEALEALGDDVSLVFYFDIQAFLNAIDSYAEEMSGEGIDDLEKAFESFLVMAAGYNDLSDGVLHSTFLLMMDTD